MAGVLVGSLSGAARASSVDYFLEVNPDAGVFELFAVASDDDNGGIASVGVDLMNVDMPVDLHLPQALLDFGGAAPAAIAGFTDVRSDASPVGGSQPILGGGNFVFGFGQTSGDLTTFAVANQFVQPQYEARLLVASGTFDPTGSLPEFGPTLDAFVFVDDGDSSFVTPDSITGAVLIVPEPAAAALLAAGVLVVARRRVR